MEDLSIPGRTPGRIRFPRGLHMTSEEFFEFCRENRDWRFERTAEGEIIVMPSDARTSIAPTARSIASKHPPSCAASRFSRASS
jgi:Uma2 family endonuclease